VELVQKAIRNSSQSRGLVFDPFGGLGSTLIACETSGRRARLIELDPKYVVRLARVLGPFRRFNLAHPKLLILRRGGFGLTFI
jgi:DNA modification methylase